MHYFNLLRHLDDNKSINKVDKIINYLLFEQKNKKPGKKFRLTVRVEEVWCPAGLARLLHPAQQKP
jgi:hypothetical protein